MTKIMLRQCVTLLRCSTEPSCRFGVILRNAFAAHIVTTKVVLRRGVTACCGNLIVFHRPDWVCFSISCSANKVAEEFLF